jgi:ABC-type Fe3+-hydroxamate transport system substrate-binding protein
MKIFDSRNKEFELGQNYNKVVSLLPSISELIFDIHAESKLIAVTNQCVYPSYLKHEKTLVGDLLDLDLTTIDSLQPDIIFASLEENNQDDIDKLDKKYNVFLIDVKNIDQAMQNIENIGRLLGRRTEAQKINLKIDMQIKDFELVSKDLLYRSAGYFIYNTPMVAVGNDNFTNHMLGRMKIKNVFQDLKERYPEVKSANIHLGNPDILLLANSVDYQFEDKDAIEIGSSTHDASIFFVDGTMFSWYGSRIIKAFDYLKLLVVKFKEMT